MMVISTQWEEEETLVKNLLTINLQQAEVEDSHQHINLAKKYIQICLRMDTFVTDAINQDIL